ncbi:MAG: fimbrillin family protein [Bacteroidales bacterium]|nr:fimbrillin family protein [Bacteroidales bacterium]
MKKYFFLASVAVVALSSCSNEEISEVSVLPGTGATPIDFTAYAAGATRYSASEAGIGNLAYNEDEKSGGFSLTGVYTVDNELAYIENLNNAVYTADAEADVHSCSSVDETIAMWPSEVSSDMQYSFYAYYPAGSQSVALDAEQGQLNITVVNPETDVMAAYKKVTAGNAVALEFKHLLAQVEIKVQYDGEYYASLAATDAQLTSLSLRAPQYSTYDFAESSIVANPETLSVYTFVAESVSANASLTGYGTAMIPANSGNGTSCELSISYYFALQGDQVLEYEKTANVTIVAGFKNVINVTVKGDTPISITASVAPWESKDAQPVNL